MIKMTYFSLSFCLRKSSVNWSRTRWYTEDTTEEEQQQWIVNAQLVQM